MPRKQHIIIIGNPGRGKSTILNGLVGRAIFDSGLSFGKGLTRVLQLHEHDGVVYGDTPGLADAKLRKAAAEAIANAFKQNGSYKLIFVVTLEAARARAEDVTTIKLVMDALPAGTPYGIIINKLSQREYNTLITYGEEFMDVKSCLDGDNHIACDVFFQLNVPELVDADNVVVPPSKELKEWIEDLPSTDIEASDVKDIKENEFAAEMEKANALIQQLRNDMAAAEQRFQQQTSALMQQIKDLKSRKRRPWWKIW